MSHRNCGHISKKFGKTLLKHPTNPRKGFITCIVSIILKKISNSNALFYTDFRVDPIRQFACVYGCNMV